MAICPFLSGLAPTECLMEGCQLWDATLELCSLSATKALISLGLEDFIPPPWYVDAGVAPETSPAYSGMTIRTTQPSSPSGSAGSSSKSITAYPYTIPADRDEWESLGYAWDETKNKPQTTAPELEILSEDGDYTLIKVTETCSSSAGPTMRWSTSDKDNVYYADDVVNTGDTIKVKTSELSSLKVKSMNNVCKIDDPGEGAIATIPQGD